MMHLLTRTTANSAQALRDALEASNAVIQFQPDGTILTANKAFLDVMGYTLDEIEGQHHRIFMPEGDVQSDDYAKFWQSLRNGEHHTSEFRRVRKDSQSVWIRAFYVPVRDGAGAVTKVIKIASDVTAEKTRELEVEALTEAFSRTQAMIYFDLQGHILDANENFCTAMGYDLSEIKGKHHRMFVEPDYAASDAYQTFWDKLRAGEHATGEFKRVGKGGREVWIQATYNQILDLDGNVSKIVKFAVDVTEKVRNRMEAEAVSRKVDECLTQISTSMTSVSERSSSAATASSETMQTVQAVASAAEEFEASAREIAESMATSRNQVEGAMAEASTADQSAKKLSEAAEAMNKVVELIQNIASQINLLALNATIESARAGEAGKGFAVVAHEVKSLAQQVATATGQIADEISGIQAVSTDVVERLVSITASVESVQSSVVGVASAIEEQSATTRDVTRNMQTAASSVGDINTSLTSIAEAIATANQLAANGAELSKRLKSAS